MLLNVLPSGKVITVCTDWPAGSRYTLTNTPSPSSAAVIGNMNSDEPGGELPPMTWTNASHPLLPQGAPPVQG